MAQELTLLEKYFPKDLSELKLPPRLLDLIESSTNRDSTYKLLLNGTPGTGKSTTARLISKGHDILMVSGSNDFNIHTIRDKIYPFIGSMSVMQKKKTLIIEECENIRDQLQDAFKIILDKGLKCNFIFLTNEVESVNSAIRSRCTDIKYNFQASEKEQQINNYIMFIKNICETEKIAYDNTGIKELYRTNFPDFRHVLVVMQQLIDGKQPLTRETVLNLAESSAQNVDLYALIESENDPQKFYEKITEYKGKERESLISLGEPYFLYLNSKGKFEQTLKAAIIVADYSNRFVTTINKFATFFACVTQLKTLFR